MKKYIAIGHFKENENVTSIAMACNSVADFRKDCIHNGFVVWCVISEKKMEVLKSCSRFDLLPEVAKLNSNYRRWDVLMDYIEQCADIMLERLENAI